MYDTNRADDATVVKRCGPGVKKALCTINTPSSRLSFRLPINNRSLINFYIKNYNFCYNTNRAYPRHGGEAMWTFSQNITGYPLRYFLMYVLS